MRQFLRYHWRAFGESYVPEEVAKASGPGAILFVLFTFVAVVLLPAFVEPVASVVQFRYPGLPVVVMLVATGFSYAGWRKGLRGKVGMACTLVDTALSLAAFQLSAALTSPPASYAYAGVAGLVVLASQSRLYGLTLPFGLATCLPLGGIPLVTGADAPLMIISFSSCVLCLWSSSMTRTSSRLRQQNIRLRSALETANEVVDSSRQVVLAGLLLDVGYFVHEMRNAQSSLAANIAYLRDQRPEGEELDECLLEVEAANKRLRDVSDDVLAMLKRRGHDDAKPFCVAEALRKVPTWSGDARVTMEAEAGTLLVQGFERDLVGALAQLVRNAGQAGARLIHISLEGDPGSGSLALMVDDDGPGIPEERQRDVFEPFKRSPDGDGLGLGLYLVKKRVELMGGRVSVGGSPLGGARFTLELPAASEVAGHMLKEGAWSSTTAPASD